MCCRFSGRYPRNSVGGLAPPRQDGDLIDQDPELWWQAAVTAILKLGQTVDLAGVERIAVDGTSGTLLLINAAGQPRSLGLDV